MSHSMIINFQTYSSAFTNPIVSYQRDNGIEKTSNATCFRLTANVDEERYQCWAALADLEPSHTYYVYASIKPKYSDAPKQITIPTDITNMESRFKFRSAPALNDVATPFVFVNGGDFSWSDSGISLSNFGAQQEPLFAIVGGDIAYE